MSSQTPQPNSIPEEWLSAYLDDELDADQRQLVENAVRQNTQLAQLLRDLQATRTLVQQLPSFPNAVSMRSKTIGEGVNADLEDGLLESATPTNLGSFEKASQSVSNVGAGEPRRRSDRNDSDSDSDSDTGMFRIGPWQLSQWRTMALAASVVGLAVIGSLAWYGVFGGNSGSVALAPSAPPGSMMPESFKSDSNKSDSNNLVDNEAGPSGFEGSRGVLPKRSLGAASPESSQSDLPGAVAPTTDAKAPSVQDSNLAGTLAEMSNEPVGGIRQDAVPTLKDSPEIAMLPNADVLAATPADSTPSDKTIPPQQLEPSANIASALSSPPPSDPPNVAANIPPDRVANSLGSSSMVPPSTMIESRGIAPSSPTESSRLSIPDKTNSPSAPSMTAPKGIESFADPARINQESGSVQNLQSGYGAGNPPAAGIRSPNFGPDRSGPGGSGPGGMGGGMAGGLGGMAGGMGGGGFGAAPGAASRAAPATAAPKATPLADQSGQGGRSKVSEAKKSLEMKSSIVTKALVHRTNAWSEQEMLTQLETNALLRQVGSLRVKSNNESQLSSLPAKASPVRIAVVSLDAEQRQVLMQLAQQLLPSSKLQDDKETMQAFFLSSKELDQLQQSFSSSSKGSISFTISSPAEPATDRCVLIVNPK